MRLRGLTAVVAAAVLVGGVASAAVGSSGSGPRTARPVCGPAGATTLAASGVARVYASGGNVFGCSKAAAGSVELGQTRSCIRRPEVGPVRVRGEIAGYGVRLCGVDTGEGEIVVRRLDDRRILHRAAAVRASTGPESYSQVASLVLALGGSVAWVGTSQSIVTQAGGVTEVHAIDRVGSRLLDSGSTVRPGSLRLHGARVTWRHGSATRSATLR